MILKDDSLILRALEEKDAEVLYEMINDPEVERSVVGWSYPVSMNNQLRWLSNQNNDSNVRYAIEFESDTVGVAILSSIDFKNRSANLNIKLIKNARHKGIGSKAIKLLIKYCFEELNLFILTASVLEDNTSSRFLWQKLGFNEDAILRNRIFKENKYKNLVVYSITKDEYEERNR